MSLNRLFASLPDARRMIPSWDLAALNERLDAPSRSRYYAGLAGRSADPAMLGRLSAYAAANVEPRARRETDTAAADITDRIRVRGIVLPAVEAWLAQTESGANHPPAAR